MDDTIKEGKGGGGGEGGGGEEGGDRKERKKVEPGERDTDATEKRERGWGVEGDERKGKE